MQWSLLPGKVPCRYPRKTTLEKFFPPKRKVLDGDSILLLTCRGRWVVNPLPLLLPYIDPKNERYKLLEKIMYRAGDCHRRPQQIPTFGNHDCKFVLYHLTDSVFTSALSSFVSSF